MYICVCMYASMYVCICVYVRIFCYCRDDPEPSFPHQEALQHPQDHQEPAMDQVEETTRDCEAQSEVSTSRV